MGQILPGCSLPLMCVACMFIEDRIQIANQRTQHNCSYQPTAHQVDDTHPRYQVSSVLRHTLQSNTCTIYLHGLWQYPGDIATQYLQVQNVGTAVLCEPHALTRCLALATHPRFLWVNGNLFNSYIYSSLPVA